MLEAAASGIPTRRTATQRSKELQSAPEFWTNAERAQRFVTERKDVRSIVEPFRSIATAYEELAILGDMAKDAGESAVIADAETALATIEKAVHDLDWPQR